MTGELVISSPGSETAAVLYDDKVLDQALALADKLSRASMVPKAMRGNPGDILLTILAGRELGLSPMASFRGINVIEGRVGMSADLMVALVLQSPHCEYFRLVETTNELATYTTKRKGDPEPTTYTFTLEDAKKAKLLNRGNDPSDNNWNKWAGNMLRARASSQLARMKYQDVLFGIDLPEAIEETVKAEVITTSPAMVSPNIQLHGQGYAYTGESASPRTSLDVNFAGSNTIDVGTTELEAKPVNPDEQKFYEFSDKIEACDTQQKLKALAPDIKKLSKELQDTLRPIYSAKLSQLKANEPDPAEAIK